MLRNRGTLLAVVLLLGMVLFFQVDCYVQASFVPEGLSGHSFKAYQLNQSTESRIYPHKPRSMPPPSSEADPIIIDGDPNFHSQAQVNMWPGSGTPGDPYLIENFLIDAEGTGSCISIWNTQVHFIINRCTLTGATLPGFMSGSGIVLYLVRNAVLVNNTCYDNLYGIQLGSVEYVNVTLNTCMNNYETGLVLSSPSGPGTNTNHIQWNTFADNPTNNIVDSGPGGHYVCSYNYYSDYTGSDTNYDGIGDTPYPIPGSSQNQDPYPAMYEPTPPIWTTPLPDWVLEFGDSFTYDLNASSQPPLDTTTWTINDTAHFEVDENGVITNATTLPVGTYGVRARVENLYGIPTAGSFTIRVQDTTPPIWRCPDIYNVSFGGLVALQLEALDASGVVQWEINDLVRFSITDTGTLTSTHILSVGQYEIIVIVSDSYENSILKPILVDISYMDLTRIFILGTDIVVSISTLLVVWGLIRMRRSMPQEPE